MAAIYEYTKVGKRRRKRKKQDGLGDPDSKNQ
jgi:hypothetical protein